MSSLPKGPQLVGAARNGTLNLEHLVDPIGDRVAPIHIAAVLGTLWVSSDGYDAAATRITELTGYSGFVPGSKDGDLDGFASTMLAQKRDGVTWSDTNVRRLVDDYTSGAIPEEHMAAVLGTIMVEDMQVTETVALTRAMYESGESLHFPDSSAKRVGKHSTGGIADGISLFLAPLLAAWSPLLHVPMMSGRGLGHTGGTLDKLEAIPGVNVKLDHGHIRRQVGRIGLAIFEQSDTLVPADRKLYALRNATNCVANNGLIVGSILSKKLAEGTGSLVMDVKTGGGAFLNTYAKARSFAQLMTQVAHGSGLLSTALITDMNQPLGRYAGNVLEVVEAVELLLQRQPNTRDSRYVEVATTLAVEMARLAGIEPAEGVYTPLGDGTVDGSPAYQKFRAMVEAQGGNPTYLNGLVARMDQKGSLLELARKGDADGIKYVLNPAGNIDVHTVRAPYNGYVLGMQLTDIGEAIRGLGAGRHKQDDPINTDVGVIFTAELEDEVRKGDPLAVILHDGKTGNPEAIGEYIHVGRPGLIKERIMYNAA